VTTAPGTHPEGEELVALLFGDVTDAERRDLERHLDECPACEAVLEELATTTGELAVAAPPVAPPPGLREAVLGGIREPEPVPAPAGPARARTRSRWLRWPRIAVPALAAVAVAVAIVFAVNSSQEPAARTVALSGGAGAVHVQGSSASMDASGLAPAPAGHTYEVWVIRNGTPRPAGTFASGSADVPVSGDVASGDVIAVTVEPAGGSAKPTSSPITSARI
jgi:anti-sigma-K factor RskA